MEFASNDEDRVPDRLYDEHPARSYSNHYTRVDARDAGVNLS
jgi:hypothetical protein